MQDLFQQIQKLQEKHEALWDHVHKLHEGFDEFQQELRVLEEYAKRGGVRALRSCRAGLRKAPDAERVELALRSSARGGVKKVEITPNAQGSAIVSINGGKGFRLTEMLRVLLHVLCENDDESQDVFVGFRSWQEIGVRLGEQLARKVGKHAIEQNLSRLRTELRRNWDGRSAANPYLVQTHRRMGARFLLRRDGKLVIRREAP